jgi:hypothetical protein
MNIVLKFLASLDRSNIQDELFCTASLGLRLAVEQLGSLNATVPEWWQLILAKQGDLWDDFHYQNAVNILL